QHLTIGQLRMRYAEVFGESLRTGNKAWLVRRLAWRLQALAEGGLSERARQRATLLAHETTLRITPPRVHSDQPTAQVASEPPAPRLPPPGTLLRRAYKGRIVHVRILYLGFEFEGVVYPSLSAVAKAITGDHYNGFLFFRLGRKTGGA